MSQWVRVGLGVALVVVMAAASSGALGSTAWATISLPRLPVQQGDNDEDNDGGPTITLNVNSTLDEVDASPGDGVCASAANRCTLRAAVMEANARGGHHTINVPAGTYTLTIAGTNETNAATGDLNIRGDITMVGAGASSTIIDANQIDRVIEVRSGADLEIRDVTLRNGQKMTEPGGGIYAQGNIKVVASAVSGNTAGNDGGGIYGFRLILIDSDISGNTLLSPSGNGGGLFVYGDLTISGSTIRGNSAPIGSGVFSSNILSMTNSTISNNIASGDGSITGLAGGLFYDGSYGEGRLTNVTIANNSAPRGSGIYKGSGDLQIRNSIVATNNGSSDCFRAGAIISLGNNIEGGTGCGFIATGDRQNTNPNLAALADNGGPTRTHALQPGSPAIDGGNNVGCPGVDQRGIQRPRDGDNNGSTICDIGAYEAPGTLGTPPPDPDNDDNQDEDDDNVSIPGPTPTPNPDNQQDDDNLDGDNGEQPGTPGQTTLLYEMCPGAVRLPVQSLNGFATGQTVRINPGGANQEDARVVDVGCDGRILSLAAALQFRHQGGERVIVVAQAAGAATTINQRPDDDGDRSQQNRRTEEQRLQDEHTNRSGRDDVHSEGDVSAVDLTKQPPEITILTRDGPQVVQLLCGDQCPTVRVGDYVEVDGTKQHEGLFHADNVTVTSR